MKDAAIEHQVRSLLISGSRGIDTPLLWGGSVVKYLALGVHSKEERQHHAKALDGGIT